MLQDMIINHYLGEDISHDFVEIPKDDGKICIVCSKRIYWEN